LEGVTMDKLKPLGYQVMVEMDVLEEEKIGSIYIPTKSKNMFDDACEKGTVLELGPLAYKGIANGQSQEPWVKPGDRVYVKMYGGRRFKYKSGKVIRMVNDEDLNVLIVDEDLEDKLV
jgi:co-chaperonin GroES (HSP10)